MAGLLRPLRSFCRLQCSGRPSASWTACFAAAYTIRFPVQKITKAAHKLGGRRVTSQVSYNCVASACEKSLVWRAALCFRGPQPDAVAVAVHPGPMCCYSRKAQSMFSTRHRRRCAAAAGTTSTTVGAIYVHAHLGSTRSISACESPSCKSNFSNRGT